MYQQLFEQAESLFKPFNDFVELNLKSMDAFRDKQAELAGVMVAEGLNMAKDMMDISDMGELCDNQQNHIVAIQEKMSVSARESYALWADTQYRFGDFFQTEVAQPVKEAAAPQAKKAKRAPARSRKSAKKASAPKPVEPSDVSQDGAVKEEHTQAVAVGS